MYRLFALALGFAATSTMAQDRSEPVLTGLWKGTSSSGHEVTLTGTGTLCRIEVTWAAGHIGGFCAFQRNGTIIQVVVDQRNSSAFSQPVYLPSAESAPQTQGVATLPNVALFLEQRSYSKLQGHLVGVGGNTHVTLKKH